MVILFIIAVIIVMILLGAASLSENFVIETDLVINKPKQQVFDYLTILRNGDQYNKWVMQDPDLRKEFTGTDGTVGFIYKWNSDMKGVGQGEQVITGIKEGERIDYEIRFIKPFENVCYSSLITKVVNDTQTNVSWSFSGKRNFVMRMFHFLFNLKKILKKDLHASLINLKIVLEKS
jgi:uncharacterized protein YndB with AHSA1/START domain